MTAEQKARGMLYRMGFDKAQGVPVEELIELAYLILNHISSKDVFVPIWKLSQVEDRNTALFAHTMIIQAETENIARLLAQLNESVERDSELGWIKPADATCERIKMHGTGNRVILVA